jgi:hypothetical protein
MVVAIVQFRSILTEMRRGADVSPRTDPLQASRGETSG